MCLGGATLTTITNVLLSCREEHHNIMKPQRKKLRRLAHKSWVLRQRLEGTSARTIARGCGVSVSTVYRWLRQTRNLITLPGYLHLSQKAINITDDNVILHGRKDLCPTYQRICDIYKDQFYRTSLLCMSQHVFNQQYEKQRFINTLLMLGYIQDDINLNKNPWKALNEWLHCPTKI